MALAVPHQVRDLVRRGVVDRLMRQLGDRCRVASPHAGRADHAHRARIERGFERREQRLCPHQLAGQAVAHAHRERRRRRLALLDHVEMGVEGRDLVDLGLGKAHLVGKRRQMRRRQMAVAVLDQVEMLDQEIAPARPLAEQGAHLLERRILELAALRMTAVAPLAALPMLADLALDHPRSYLAPRAPRRRGVRDHRIGRGCEAICGRAVRPRGTAWRLA